MFSFFINFNFIIILISLGLISLSMSALDIIFSMRFSLLLPNKTFLLCFVFFSLFLKNFLQFYYSKRILSFSWCTNKSSKQGKWNTALIINGKPKAATYLRSVLLIISSPTNFRKNIIIYFIDFIKSKLHGIV